MNALDRASALGTRDGTEGAKAWWVEGESLHVSPATMLAGRKFWPEPDLTVAYPSDLLLIFEQAMIHAGSKGHVAKQLSDAIHAAYESAYRAAVETTIETAATLTTIRTPLTTIRTDQLQPGDRVRASNLKGVDPDAILIVARAWGWGEDTDRWAYVDFRIEGDEVGSGRATVRRDREWEIVQ